MHFPVVDPSDHRNSDHFKVYKKLCVKRNLLMHNCAILPNAKESTMKQGTLDGAVTREPRMPLFSTNGLLDYVIELIVSKDNVRPCDCWLILSRC
jgi:hypothetical protein